MLYLPDLVQTLSPLPTPFCARVTFSSFYENKMDPWEACVFIYSFVYKHGAHWMLELNKICENFLSVEKRTGRVELLLCSILITTAMNSELLINLMNNYSDIKNGLGSLEVEDKQYSCLIYCAVAHCPNQSCGTNRLSLHVRNWVYLVNNATPVFWMDNLTLFNRTSKKMFLLLQCTVFGY